MLFIGNQGITDFPIELGHRGACAHESGYKSAITYLKESIQKLNARNIRDWEDKIMERFSLQFRDRQVQSVLQRGQSKFVQLSFEPRQGLTKHRAPLALTVVVLTGQVSFTVGDRTERLNASDMLAIGPDVEHEIEAIERSTVLLVLTPHDENP